ncbi:hypothetical protein F5883DRAFT_103258 [Diaporthe sp. PMI_573]|nr:hypothetical protein F5883DRAFT_103258 [Diaporthaceae sp. PMI_573]
MRTIPPDLLTSYYYNYSPDGCDDTRVTWLYTFLGGVLLVWPSCFWLGSGMRGVMLDCLGVGTTTVYNLCCLWIMMNGSERA